MKRYLLILFLFASAVLSAQTTTSAGFGLDPSDEQAVAEMKARMDRIRKHRPTLALVLSGGGAKGAATVGALKYLEQYKFPVDMVVGTSIGGLIGGVYAMGYTPDFLDSLMRNIDWDRTMSDRVDWEYIPYGRRRYTSTVSRTSRTSSRKTSATPIPRTASCISRPVTAMPTAWC